MTKQNTISLNLIKNNKIYILMNELKIVSVFLNVLIIFYFIIGMKKLIL